MDKELKETLRDGETVRWSGRTAPFPLLGERTKQATILKWVGTAAVTCALLGTYCTRNAELSWKFISIIVLIAGMVMVSPLVERWNILGQKYYITNQRVLLVTRDKSVFYMDKAQIDRMERVSASGEGDTLVLGGVIFEDIKRQLRWRACHPKTNLQGQDGQDRAIGIALYGIRDADVAQALLQRPEGTMTA